VLDRLLGQHRLVTTEAATSAAVEMERTAGALLVAPAPPLFAPPAIVAVAARGERREGVVAHWQPIDQDGVQLHLMRGQLVVVGPCFALRAKHEAAALEDDLVRPARQIGLRPPPLRVVRRVPQRERLQHRLLMLQLVLEHHPEHITPPLRLPPSRYSTTDSRFEKRRLSEPDVNGRGSISTSA